MNFILKQTAIFVLYSFGLIFIAYEIYRSQHLEIVIYIACVMLLNTGLLFVRMRKNIIQIIMCIIIYQILNAGISFIVSIISLCIIDKAEWNVSFVFQIASNSRAVVFLLFGMNILIISGYYIISAAFSLLWKRMKKN
jgi:hypothetical protein